MIAVYIVANAWAAAVLVTAGELWILGCAYGLRTALTTAAILSGHHTTAAPPHPISPHTRAASHRFATLPRPTVCWPRDN